MSIDEGTKTKWRVCFTGYMMRSEESNENEDYQFTIALFPGEQKSNKLLYALDKNLPRVLQ